MKGKAKKRGDAMYVVEQILTRSPEERLRSNSSHAVTRRGWVGGKSPGAELGFLIMGQDKSEVVTAAACHKSKKSRDLGCLHYCTKGFMIFGKYLNWFLKCQQYLG